ncbi:MAG: PAS domain S-box protein [Magnetococcales bacterium]|nr:PAS domain S-box protein [Magnetococcales bacterium]
MTQEQIDPDQVLLDCRSREQILEERVDYIESLNRQFSFAMDIAAAMVRLHGKTSHTRDSSIILEEAQKYLKRLFIPFQVSSFFTVDELDSSFHLTYCDPVEHSDEARKLCDKLVETGEFAWALNQNRAVLSRTVKHPDGAVLLHLLATENRVRGMFVGVIKATQRDMSNSFINLLSIIFRNTAYAVESTELYAMLDDLNQSLENHNFTLQDEIDHRRVISRKLREQEGNLRAITQSVQDAIIVCNEVRQITFCNRAGLVMFGFQDGSILGRSLLDLFPESEHTVVKVATTAVPSEQVSSQDQQRIELIGQRSDGSAFPVEMAATPWESSENSHFTVVIQDITQRREAEERNQILQTKMLNASKLATLGEVATGVAHEINQPLTYISTFAQLLSIKVQNGDTSSERLSKDLDVVQTQIQRINDIIQHLQTFGRKDEEEFLRSSRLSIAQIIENTQLFLGQRLRLRNITLELALEPDLPLVVGNSTQMEQVFINLIQNSIHALEEQSEQPAITVSAEYVESDQVIVVRFKDNGMGMSAEVKERIFEPFFTTKGVGEGTGIGLAIVYGIIRDHEGTIRCHSELGEGTTFTITFPVRSNGKQ